MAATSQNTQSQHPYPSPLETPTGTSVIYGAPWQGMSQDPLPLEDAPGSSSTVLPRTITMSSDNSVRNCIFRSPSISPCLEFRFTGSRGATEWDKWDESIGRWFHPTPCYASRHPAGAFSQRVFSQFPHFMNPSHSQLYLYFQSSRLVGLRCRRGLMSTVAGNGTSRSWNRFHSVWMASLELTWEMRFANTSQVSMAGMTPCCKVLPVSFLVG